MTNTTDYTNNSLSIIAREIEKLEDAKIRLKAKRKELRLKSTPTTMSEDEERLLDRIIIALNKNGDAIDLLYQTQMAISEAINTEHYLEKNDIWGTYSN